MILSYYNNIFDLDSSYNENSGSHEITQIK